MMTVPAIYLLQQSWASDTFCCTALRAYHLLRIILFFFQVPLRGYMYAKFKEAESQGSRQMAIEKLLELCRSQPWRINQYLGVFVYVLFILALLFVFTWSHCSQEAAMLYRLCILNLAIFLIHMCLSYLWLRRMIRAEEGFYGGANEGEIETNSESKTFNSEDPLFA